MSKVLKPLVLAQEWVQNLGHASDMSIKVKRKLHDMRIFAADCGSAKHGAICVIRLDGYDVYSEWCNTHKEDIPPGTALA